MSQLIFEEIATFVGFPVSTLPIRVFEAERGQLSLMLEKVGLVATVGDG